MNRADFAFCLITSCSNGQLYGGAVESKIPLGYLHLMTWIEETEAARVGGSEGA